jgi:FkbH-like protein
MARLHVLKAMPFSRIAIESNEVLRAEAHGFSAKKYLFCRKTISLLNIAVLYYFSLRNMENLKLFVYRNYTVEPLFTKFKNTRFSGYDDITVPSGDFDAIIWFYQLPLDAIDDEAVAVIENLKNRLDLFLGYNVSTTVILFTLQRFFHISYQGSSWHLSRSISDYNNYLYSLAEKHRNFKVIDLSKFAEVTNPKPLIDWKYYYISKMLINPALIGTFHDWFVKQLNAIKSSRKKCMVLDLDNTLWGGIIGEDGLEGIALGTTYPGSAFKDFQKGLRAAAAHGVLLALCSKNNETDVWEVFEKHPDMELKKEDFVAFRINWNDKAANITAIAEELNIATDSMVFIDDDAVEREMIKKLVPDIAVPDFPDQPYKLKDYLKTIYENFFQIYRTTDEDRIKTEQYHQNARRISNSKKFPSIPEYLQSLGMVIKIEPVNSFNLSRIVQLTQKTNQFNLTTRRYTETDIGNFTNKGDIVVCASVSDKFGDNGITAVCIIKQGGTSQATIDSYLLSCRILGRGIEDAFLKTLLNHLYRHDIKDVYAEYLPTSKNVQTEKFYEKFGFKIISQENGTKKYLVSLHNEYRVDPYYEIISSLVKS